MNKDSGGFAFPDLAGYTRGMSLREWFAGMALMGCDEEISDSEEADEVAKWAYMVADAMIAARNS